jgi:hypothetical protein
MTPAYLIHALASTPLFAARAFLPAFLTALFLRFSNVIPFMNIKLSVPANASWFVSDWCLVTLGILTFLEILADKDPDIRDIMLHINSFLKTAVFFGTQSALMNNETAAIINQMIVSAFPLVYVISVLLGGLVFAISYLRNRLIELLLDIDDDDDSGVHFITSLFEDYAVLLGFILLIVFPLIVIIVASMIVGLVIVIEKNAGRKEHKIRIPCPLCAALVHPSAIRCYGCGYILEGPKQINILGWPKSRIVNDTAIHRLKLLCTKRCPVCAERLRKRSPIQECVHCHNSTFESVDEVRLYTSYIDEKRKEKNWIVIICGFIPIVGAIVVTVLAKLYIVRPFRRYIPRRRKFITKLLSKTLIYLLLVLQLFPVLGAISALLTIQVYFSVWRGAFISVAESKLPNKTASARGT